MCPMPARFCTGGGKPCFKFPSHFSESLLRICFNRAGFFIVYAIFTVFSILA